MRGFCELVFNFFVLRIFKMHFLVHVHVYIINIIKEGTHDKVSLCPLFRPSPTTAESGRLNRP